MLGRGGLARIEIEASERFGILHLLHLGAF
jgi:hypothetical protein